MGRTFSEFSEFSECDQSLKHFKDPVSNTSPAGTVVVCWSLTQEMASSNIFVTEFRIQ